MKTLVPYIVILVAVVTAGFCLTLNEIQSQENETVFTKPDDIGTGKVLGIHYYSLKQGVDPQEFERFVAKEWIAVFHELWPGVQTSFMKGGRGSKTGQYILVYEIGSIHVRDYYWPPPGDVPSEAATAIYEKCGERCTQLENRFNELAERTEFADYIALVK
jgi:hypothetical protein